MKEADLLHALSFSFFVEFACLRFASRYILRAATCDLTAQAPNQVRDPVFSEGDTIYQWPEIVLRKAIVSQNLQHTAPTVFDNVEEEAGDPQGNWPDGVVHVSSWHSWYSTMSVEMDIDIGGGMSHTFSADVEHQEYSGAWGWYKIFIDLPE